MSLAINLKNIKASIENGYIDIAFKEFKANCFPYIKQKTTSKLLYEDFEKQFIQLSAQYNDWRRAKNLNLSENSHLKNDINRIMKAFLDFISAVEELIPSDQTNLDYENIEQGVSFSREEYGGIIISLDRDFESFSKTDQQKFLGAVAELLKMDSGNIIIEKIYPGSIKIFILLPKDEAKKLKSLIESGKLSEWDVTDIEMISDQTLENYKKLDNPISGGEFQKAQKVHEEGFTFLQLGEFQKAIEKFSKAISIIPTWGTALLNRGLAYYYDNKPHKALKDFNDALIFIPYSAKIFYNRGLAKVEIQDYNGALTDFSRSINLDSNNGLAFLNRGLTLLHLKQSNSGVADITRAKKLQSDLMLHIENKEILNLVNNRISYENQGNQLELILDELNSPEISNDFCRRIYLCREAVKHATKEQNPKIWAQLQDDLGLSLRRCETSNSISEKKEAINAYKYSLEVYSRKDYPLEWASSKNGLGLALLDHMQLDDPSENIELAINAFNDALKERTYEKQPYDWGVTKINLGKAYSKRIQGKKNDNLLKAIGFFNEILSSMKIARRFPDLFQTAKSNHSLIESELNSHIKSGKKRAEIKQKMLPSKSIKVVRVFDLLKAGHFPKNQNCDFLISPKGNDSILMISHRWESESEPDPDNIQFHGSIRYIIQASMMAMGSTPNVFNGVDFSEVINSMGIYDRLLELSQEYRDKTLKGELLEDRDLFECSRMLYFYLEQTIGLDNTLLVALDLSCLAYMIRKFVFWYDYTSLPQGEKDRTVDEKRYFKSELKKIDSYFSQYYTLILWSKSSLKRAWCFLEASLASSNHNWSIFSSENSLVSSMEPAQIQQYFFTLSKFRTHSINQEISKGFSTEATEFSDLSDTYAKMLRNQSEIEEKILRGFNRKKESIDFDLSTDLSHELQRTLMKVHSDLKGKNQVQILEYLSANNYQCTNGADLKFIASKLFRFIESKFKL